MIPSETLDMWYEEDPPLLNHQPILDFFQVRDTTQLIHVCTEDDDAPQHANDWLYYLMSLAPLELPHLSTAFELEAGGISTNPGDYVMFVVGNGNFESSFPVLIYRAKDAQKMDLHYETWSVDRG